MNKNLYRLFLLLIIGISSASIQAQNVINKKAKVHQAYIDSLKDVPYPYKLPIMGSLIRKKGFDIPMPNGLMINYIVGTQDLTLNNMALGTQPGEYTDVSSIVRFSSVKPSVNVLNLRYDFWVLPFFNLYALGGLVDSKTAVNLALPFQASFEAHGKGTMLGWGAVLAGGIGPLFIQADYNMAWVSMPQLTKSNLSQVFDIRLGHTIEFNKMKASNLSIMVGAQWLKLASNTQGKVNLSELVGFTPEKKEAALGQLDDWYDELPQGQQDTFADFYGSMSNWLSNGQDTDLYYSFNKKLYYPWSLTVGANYQISKRYMLTGMYTFLGSRQQLVIGFNYRFGWRGKNYLSGLKL